MRLSIDVCMITFRRSHVHAPVIVRIKASINVDQEVRREHRTNDDQHSFVNPRHQLSRFTASSASTLANQPSLVNVDGEFPVGQCVSGLLGFLCSCVGQVGHRVLHEPSLVNVGVDLFDHWGSQENKGFFRNKTSHATWRNFNQHHFSGVLRACLGTSTQKLHDPLGRILIQWLCGLRRVGLLWGHRPFVPFSVVGGQRPPLPKQRSLRGETLFTPRRCCHPCCCTHIVALIASLFTNVVDGNHSTAELSWRPTRSTRCCRRGEWLELQMLSLSASTLLKRAAR